MVQWSPYSSCVKYVTGVPPFLINLEYLIINVLSVVALQSRLFLYCQMKSLPLAIMKNAEQSQSLGLKRKGKNRMILIITPLHWFFHQNEPLRNAYQLHLLIKTLSHRQLHLNVPASYSDINIPHYGDIYGMQRCSTSPRIACYQNSFTRIMITAKAADIFRDDHIRSQRYFYH